MRHFVKKHTHHFGLWAISGLLLIGSIFWLNNLNQLTISSQSLINNNSINLPAEPIIEKPAIITAPTNSIQPKINPLVGDSATTTPLVLEQEQKKPIVFRIFEPAVAKEFTVQIAPASTVYEAMRQLQKQLPIKFKQFGGNLGAFVESIDNIANDASDNLFWIYYVNNVAAKLGISSTKLSPNDVITWKYENAKF